MGIVGRLTIVVWAFAIYFVILKMLWEIKKIYFFVVWLILGIPICIFVVEGVIAIGVIVLPPIGFIFEI